MASSRRGEGRSAWRGCLSLQSPAQGEVRLQMWNKKLTVWTFFVKMFISSWLEVWQMRKRFLKYLPFHSFVFHYNHYWIQSLSSALLTLYQLLTLFSGVSQDWPMFQRTGWCCVVVAGMKAMRTTSMCSEFPAIVICSLLTLFYFFTLSSL